MFLTEEVGLGVCGQRAGCFDPHVRWGQFRAHGAAGSPPCGSVPALQSWTASNADINTTVHTHWARARSNAEVSGVGQAFRLLKQSPCFKERPICGERSSQNTSDCWVKRSQPGGKGSRRPWERSYELRGHGVGNEAWHHSSSTQRQKQDCPAIEG